MWHEIRPDYKMVSRDASYSPRYGVSDWAWWNEHYFIEEGTRLSSHTPTVRYTMVKSTAATPTTGVVLNGLLKTFMWPINTN